MATFPSEFDSAMRDKLGSEYTAFRESMNAPSPVSVRLNPRKRHAVSSDSKVPWSEFGFYLDQRPKFTFDPLFHAGTYYVQEASSMFLEQVFRQHITAGRLNVLDLSAAPGGKSTHILSLLDEQSVLVSNEVIRARASILAENILKWGHANAIVTNNDPKDFEKLPGLFDVIVVDAPCSGEGLFRKEPDAMNEWSPDNVNLCAARQKRIVADVWPALKDDGILIYSTCTYNDYENEDNLRWLRENNSIEFLSLSLDPAWGVVESSDGKVTGYRFYPHKVKGEGFFISAMRKKERTREMSRTKKTLSPAPGKIAGTLSSWISEVESYEFFQHQEYVFFFPAAKTDVLELIKQNLRLIQGGTTVATLKHDKVVPEHGAAMSVRVNRQNFVTIPLDYASAIQYLRRETFEWLDRPRGFQLVMFDDVPLGWINSLGNRFNNLYPIEWRIRSQPVPGHEKNAPQS